MGKTKAATEPVKSKKKAKKSEPEPKEESEESEDEDSEEEEVRAHRSLVPSSHLHTTAAWCRRILGVVRKSAVQTAFFSQYLIWSTCYELSTCSSLF
jgi:hypothetical protein